MLLTGILNRKLALNSPLLLILLGVLLLAGCTGAATEPTATPPLPTQQQLNATSTDLPSTQVPETGLPPTLSPEDMVTEPVSPLSPDAPVTEAASTQSSDAATPVREITQVSDTTDDPTGQLASTPVTSNEAWTPVEQDFNGIIMVLVPVGCFQMGRDGVSTNEAPEHEQCFEEPFWIDKTEITNARFTGLAGVAELASVNRIDDAPRDNISELEAIAFCALRDARLPTEREWEYAASGPSNLLYPWGDEWSADNATWEENSRGRSALVGSHPSNVSWVGALDMSGNVWEWTSTIDAGYPYNATDGRESVSDLGSQRIIRGGSWANQPQALTTSFRLRNIPTVRDGNIGFRCVRDY